MAKVGTEGGRSVGHRILELTLGWFLPRWVSLPLLVVLTLFRALRFERGLAWLSGRGAVAGLFLFVLLHSLIAHAADHFAGYDPAEEFMKQGARPESDHDGPDGGALGPVRDPAGRRRDCPRGLEDRRPRQVTRWPRGRVASKAILTARARVARGG